MTHKTATKGVCDCADSHRYRMKKSIFKELPFLALLLVPWQNSYSQEHFFFFFGMKLAAFWQEQKQGMKLMRSNFSFP